VHFFLPRPVIRCLGFVKLLIANADVWAVRLLCSRSIIYVSVCVIIAATVPSFARSADQGQVLRQVVLHPAQVGRGYVLKVFPSGGEVKGQVTLDLCGFRFPSESRRTGRFQVGYVRRGSSLAVSNEVVSYRLGGAALAMREVEEAVRACPPYEVPSTVRGVPPLRYQFTRLSTAGKGLLPGAIALRMTASGIVNGKKRTETSFGVYQMRSSILSGVYVYGGSVEKRRAMAFSAAAASAGNLKRRR
jgi:hypothetical protein